MPEPHRRKRIQAGQAGCIKKNRGLAARLLRKEFSSKIDHLKSNRRRVDDASNPLCNIRSAIGARAHPAWAMVTAELERNSRVANADTVDIADVPELPGLAGGGALAAKRRGKNRQVNHADAPHDAARCFGTDLAQWALREVRVR
jgi:transposase